MDENKKILPSDNHIDDHVDDEIQQCLSGNIPKSFFMFAGAGSGKTRSLIKALSFLDREFGRSYLTNAKQVAVITYTNAACDEISRRLQYKPIFAVSTIHSFLWELIRNYQTDIKEWVVASLKQELGELNEKQARRYTANRHEEIMRKTNRLTRIETVKHFSYNPNGDNVGYDSLNHSEVIKMGSEFIASEDTLQKILINKYPILLIDESQDTKKELVDALFNVCEKYKQDFIVGMFGDTMQKIYMDGKDNLASCIPDDWERPRKLMNHRSATRIVKLANVIRSTIDGQKQRARSDAEKGTVRLFIAPSASNKEAMERQVTEIMAKFANDNDWESESTYKSLILEHHMAANRFGFSNLYVPLNESKVFDTSLRDGSIAELSFLSNIISPLVMSHKSNNVFEVSRIVRQYSPLLDKKVLSANPEKQILLLQKAETAVDRLMSLWGKNNIPTCLEIIKSVQENGLFKLSERMDNILVKASADEDAKITALRTALSVPFDELERYSAYVTGNTRFATHQGIKGLEFPRVMVIMDDAEARGFLFSYEKLFGAKAKTDTDLRNEREGNDTSIMRTARLFYVACTRAEKSLAVVAYTEDVDAVRKTALENKWFIEDEVIVL